MYYLPAYRVYQIDVRILPTGEERKTFWGTHRETFVTDQIILPENIDTFLMPLSKNYKDNLHVTGDIRIQESKPLDMYLVSGDISLIKYILPKLRIKWYRQK
jgi:hypothetical protein